MRYTKRTRATIVTVILIPLILLAIGANGCPGQKEKDVRTASSIHIIVSKVSAGSGHTLAIKPDGTLWAWGGNGTGQLGLNSADYNSHPMPTQVGVDNNWQTIAANGHSLAIKNDGSLWAWGYNIDGQLGLGDTVDHDSPVQIASDKDWVKIATGNGHTMAVKTDGSLWACGRNVYGQLGLGDKTNRFTLTQIVSVTTWKNIACGERHTLGIKTDGTLWAWGEGPLGLGVPSDPISGTPATPATSPTQVGTDNNWQLIVAGDNHSLAIKTDGTLWTWGSNEYGQLGTGDTTYRYFPVQVGIETNWKAIAGGFRHTLALKTDGTIWVWGNNEWGELGLGDTINRYSPAQVGTDIDWLAVTATAGNFSIAMRNDGSVWGWGNNSVGQLGLGHLIDIVTRP